MIIKNYEINKINLNTHKLILFYGLNNASKNENIDFLISKINEKEIYNFLEKDILDKEEIFYDIVFSGSLFAKEKVILINQATDRIMKIIKEFFKKENFCSLMIINSEILEKKSKLRNFFEKKKELICVPFYPDSFENLTKFTNDFLKKKNIAISRENINFLVNRSNGDRAFLKKELEKILIYSINKKTLNTKELIKLTNLIENHSIAELVDSSLTHNSKKTIRILNENNYSEEDCILIIRIYLNKCKRILKLAKELIVNKDISKTILNARPPIFWKEREIIKQQLEYWTAFEIQKLILKLFDIERILKKYNKNSINIVYDFIFELLSRKTNSYSL